MFYRLPILFSASYYFLLLLAQLLLINFEQDNVYSFYNISRIILDNLTSFFFIITLSCIFFYQNKLYFYTPKNKQKIILFAGFFTLIYLIIKYLSFQFFLLVLFPKLIKGSYMYHHAYNDIYTLLYQVVSLVAYIWLFIISAIVLYLMTKYCRGYFQTPLIDDSTQSYQNQFVDEMHQLNSNINVVEYKKLYAIIFSAIFCCMANGVLWSTYFNIFVSIPEIRMLIEEYYLTIFFYAFFSIGINYWFLYRICQKFIIRTYSWIPVSSLLTSCAITLVLFGIIISVMTSLVLPFVFIFQSIIIFILWFVISYCLLYFLTRFTLRRYFS